MTETVQVNGESDEMLSIFAESEDELDSLFDEPLVPAELSELSMQTWDRIYCANPTIESISIANRSAPPIPGLFAPSVRLPPELADEIMQKCMEKYFDGKTVNQVMLFGRTLPLSTDLSEGGLPSFLTSLLSTISDLLLPVLPAHTHGLIFPPPEAPIRARQAILNLYNPGDGISPHVDLLKRFGDGIMGISLGSGCVMNFRKEQKGNEASIMHTGDADELSKCLSISGDEEQWDLYLPERSIIVLSEDARYIWSHGIEGRTKDFVRGEQDDRGEWIVRRVRLSITFRWLLPGADIVGEPDQ
jgi:hypothetical protein